MVFCLIFSHSGSKALEAPKAEKKARCGSLLMIEVLTCQLETKGNFKVMLIGREGDKYTIALWKL